MDQEFGYRKRPTAQHGQYLAPGASAVYGSVLGSLAPLLETVDPNLDVALLRVPLLVPSRHLREGGLHAVYFALKVSDGAKDCSDVSFAHLGSPEAAHVLGGRGGGRSGLVADGGDGGHGYVEGGDGTLGDGGKRNAGKDLGGP